MKETPSHIDFDLLAKYFADECSTEEVAKIAAWRAESEDNEVEFERMKQIFSIDLPQLNIDTESAWQKTAARISTADKKIIPLSQNNKTATKKFNLLWRIAAVLLVGVSLYFIGTNQLEKSDIQAFNSTETQTKEVELNDGSKVFLNKSSELTFQLNSKEKSRNAYLKGEAFFEVSHNKKLPFVVEVEHLMITVLGTSFNVISNENSGEAKVQVSTGTVQVTVKGSNETLILSAGESSSYNIKTNSLEKISETNENAMYWRTGKLDFKSAELKEVAEVISEHFDIPILVPDKIANCRISVQFNNDTLETILEVICATLQLNLIKNKQGYELQGKAC